MQLTATHINYFFICHRKLWLFANGINMEHTSDTVAEGRFIHETSYPQRAEKYTELSIGGSQIDFYDARNKIIHEVKKSDKIEAAHEWQVKYYIWLLEQNGIEDAKGIIEYPRLHTNKEIVLEDTDRIELQKIIQGIEAITQEENCPPRINSRICKNCSYYEFCYVEETL